MPPVGGKQNGVPFVVIAINCHQGKGSCTRLQQSMCCLECAACLDIGGCCLSRAASRENQKECASILHISYCTHVSVQAIRRSAATPCYVCAGRPWILLLWTLLRHHCLLIPTAPAVALRQAIRSRALFWYAIVAGRSADSNTN